MAMPGEVGSAEQDKAVRLMTLRDIGIVREVEMAAGELFRSISEPRIARCADDEPFTIEELTSFIEREHSWVATDGGAVVGFVAVEVLEGCAHVEEIAVAPEFGRRRHGAALLHEVERWASSAGLAALTLTTFRDVAWNAPWYERLGFRVLGEDEWTPGLSAVREAEDAHGLPAELRVVMRRDLDEADRDGAADERSRD